MQPKYPIYIVSKSRWDSRLTSKALEKIKVPYYIVVEEQEYKEYTNVIDKNKVLILDKKYQKNYDTFDNLGDTKSKGPGAARNFCWEHSIKNGFKYHWVMDDNISAFCRLNKNRKIRVNSGTIFKCAEDFVDRYKNVAIAGFNYRFFAPERETMPAFYLNTRIYSCLLIRNDIPYRWRGRYNEDTDLSLRVLKDDWCTVLFNAFLCDKLGTQRIGGGNTKDFYEKEGTMPKSQMLIDMHPDVAKIVWKWDRWHHHVDYSKFRNNKLIKVDNYSEFVEDKVNNYGMKLIKL